MKLAPMPYSVESMCNVKEDSRAHSFVLKCFFKDVGDTMHLVYCRASFYETKHVLALSVSLH
jgi:hypothetical protein